MALFLQGAAIVGISILIALAGMAVVRRLVTFDTLRQHNEVAGFIYAVLGLAYGVLLAFVVIAVWENFKGAQQDAENEANDIAALYRVAQGLPDPARQQFSRLIPEYLRVVIDEEWPAMAHTRPDPPAHRLVNELWATFYRIEPQSNRDTTLQAKLLDQLTAFDASRRSRLLDARAQLPPILWWALIEGGVLTVGFTYFFGLKDWRAQALMTAALAGTVALVLFVTFELNHPFQGYVVVAPDAFEHALRLLQSPGG